MTPHPRSLPRPLALALLALLAALPARAAWIPNGVPLCTAPGLQYLPAVAPDPVGGMFVAWIDERAGGRQLYLQHLTPGGDLAPGWPANGQLVAAGPVFQVELLPDGAGGVFVGWGQGTPDTDIYALRVSGGGAIAPGWLAGGTPVCTSPSLQENMDMVSDAAGGVILVWKDHFLGDLAAQRMSPLGVALWTANGVRVCEEPHAQEMPATASDGAGGVFVAWVDYRNANEDIYGQHLGASGVPAPGWSAAGNPICTASGVQFYVSAIPDGLGGMIAAWGDRRAGNPAVWALRVSSDGTRPAGWGENGNAVRTGMGALPAPGLATDGLGGAFVLWGDLLTPFGLKLEVLRVTSSGAVMSGISPNIIAAQPNGLGVAAITTDGSGGAYVVWSETRTLPYPDVFATRLGPSGQRLPSWPPAGTPISTAPMAQDFAGIAADGFGGVLICWQDDRNASRDLYAFRLPVEAPVPVLVSLASVEAASDRVAIAWWLGGDPIRAATVERARAAGEWRPIGTATLAGSQRATFEDRDVRAGERWGYRLVIESDGASVPAGETWVDVPLAPRLMLAAPSPNPAVNGTTLRFALASNAPARLVLFDVAGRLVWERRWDAPRAGEQTLALGARELPEPGVYLLRLEQAGEVRMVRLGVVR